MKSFLFIFVLITSSLFVFGQQRIILGESPIKLICGESYILSGCVEVSGMSGLNYVNIIAGIGNSSFDGDFVELTKFEIPKSGLIHVNKIIPLNSDVEGEFFIMLLGDPKAEIIKADISLLDSDKLNIISLSVGKSASFGGYSALSREAVYNTNEGIYIDSVDNINGSYSVEDNYPNASEMLYEYKIFVDSDFGNDLNSGKSRVITAFDGPKKTISAASLDADENKKIILLRSSSPHFLGEFSQSGKAINISAEGSVIIKGVSK